MNANGRWSTTSVLDAVWSLCLCSPSGRRYPRNGVRIVERDDALRNSTSMVTWPPHTQVFAVER